MSMTGVTCNITAPDLDGDGQRDVLLELSSGAGSSRWPFKWTGDVLVGKEAR